MNYIHVQKRRLKRLWFDPLYGTSQRSIQNHPTRYSLDGLVFVQSSAKNLYRVSTTVQLSCTCIHSLRHTHKKVQSRTLNWFFGLFLYRGLWKGSVYNQMFSAQYNSFMKRRTLNYPKNILKNTSENVAAMVSFEEPF